MGRTVVRALLGFAGAVLLLVGGAVAVLGGWISATLTGQDSLRTAPESIDAFGCSTLIMEIADVRVDAGALARIEPLADRSTSLVTIRVNAETTEPFLVGVADQQDVERQLLGTRYCLVESVESGWSLTSISVDPDAPDAQFTGVAGLWATAISGEDVVLPLPEPGSSVVISGSDDSSMESIEIAGELEITGASTVGWAALVGGIATAVVGIGVLLVSTLTLRARGRHEGRQEEPPEVGPSA